MKGTEEHFNKAAAAHKIENAIGWAKHPVFDAGPLSYRLQMELKRQRSIRCACDAAVHLLPVVVERLRALQIILNWSPGVEGGRDGELDRGDSRRATCPQHRCVPLREMDSRSLRGAR